MSDTTSTEVAVQEEPHADHNHVCDECAKEIHATYEYIRELHQFVEDFDLSDILGKAQMPSGPMGMILKSLIK